MRRTLVTAALVSLALAAPGRAEEGMWTFDAFPAAKMRTELGWAPDAAWLARVQAASVRLTGGCSASFVSGEGLILTNHHCARDCAQDLSTADHDYIANGFLAGDRKAEGLCPGQQAEVATAITDVTPAVKAAIGPATGGALVAARDAAIAKLEHDGCPDTKKTRCQVVTLFGGAQFKLYAYHKYSDVRLVWVPEAQAAAFGGDPDNFNFPRYNLDAAFLRAYEDGKPAATPQHLTWNPRAPTEGEIVLVSGNPGSTNRLYTGAQRVYSRDTQFPLMLTLYSEYRGRLISKMDASAENKRTGYEELFSLENSFKATNGYVGSLRDRSFSAKLDAEEAALRAKVAVDPALAARIGDPWSALDKITMRQAELFYDYTLLESRAGWRSELFSYARTLVRAAAERARPDAERMANFTDSQLPLLAKQLADAKPIYPWIEQVSLEFWLSKSREYLTADSPAVKTLLGKESPEALAARLVAGTKLADPAIRKALFDGGKAAIDASTDPLIRFVAATDADARAIRTKWRAEVTGPTAAASAKVADARAAVYGDSVYPDATFTLRLSYATVKGWTERGTPVPYLTRFGGMWDRATGQDPFDLPPAFAAAKDRIDMAAPFDFVSTNDIIGGNSGSPVIARDGSVIGAAFDGNIHMLGNNFGYDPVLSRSVAVSAAAIQQALQKIYPAPALLKELAAK